MAGREELALQVVDLAKTAVLADNHFLSTAVGRLHTVPMQLTSSFATDGYFLAFDSRHVLARFKRAGLPPKRNLLHCIAHCLFLHPYVSASVDQPLWNLACDIAAERVVSDLLGPLPDERGTRVTLTLMQIERDLGSRITAEKVYRRLREGWWSDVAGEWMTIMHSDAHDMWYAPAHSGDDQQGEGVGEGTEPSGGIGSTEGNADSSQTSGGDGDRNRSERQDPAGREDEAHEQPDGEREGDAISQSSSSPGKGVHAHGNAQRPNRPSGNRSPQNANGASDSPNQREASDDQTSSAGADGTSPLGNDGATNTSATRIARGKEAGTDAGNISETVIAQDRHHGLRQTALPREQQEREWRQVATSLAVNLQTLSARHGGRLSGFVDDLREAARPHADYTSFLRQFATPGEVMRLSDEEFDAVFYTYGMQLYGDTPLIEPLEYREERRVREFVIVIDTSASVRGDIVHSFVETTFAILKESESFFGHVHVRILQCDAQVRTDDRIESLADLEQWGRSMRVIGGGGTDFRPAFAYVDNLVEQGEFFDLGGLVYFTDGYGTYPEWMPTYRSAFVFYDEDRRGAVVPPWAVQIVLDGDTIREAESTRQFRKERIGA